MDVIYLYDLNLISVVSVVVIDLFALRNRCEKKGFHLSSGFAFYVVSSRSSLEVYDLE